MRTFFTENGDGDTGVWSDASIFSGLSSCSTFLDVNKHKDKYNTGFYGIKADRGLSGGIKDKIDKIR
jgi:hypothetical protein